MSCSSQPDLPIGLSSLLSPPRDAPPRGTRRVCPLCSPAVTTVSTPRPKIPTHLPLPRSGGGGEEELRQEAESELGVPHPVLALPLGPSPLRQQKQSPRRLEKRPKPSRQGFSKLHPCVSEVSEVQQSAFSRQPPLPFKTLATGRA